EPGRAAGAHNWLGWRRQDSPETIERALEHLGAALSLSPRFGPARANLATALERAGRGDEAYEQHALALGCADAFDRALSHERRGAYEARHGWPRNALRSFRAALAEDRKGGGAREATYREAIEWLQGEMTGRGIPWAPA